MAKKRRKKSILNSTFYRIYFALIAVGIIVIIVGTVMLNGILKDYEDAQPIYVAQRAAALFENGNYEAIFDLDTSMRDVAQEDREFYIESLRDITAGKQVSWSEVYSGDPDRKVYRVLMDGEKFADFTLIPSGITTERGNRVWTLNSITTNVELKAKETPTPEPVATPEPTPDPRAVCRITVPSDFTVTVDGRKLGANDVARAGIEIVPRGFLPETVTAPTLTEYATYCDTETPEITVTDSKGNPQTLTRDDTLAWSCGLPENTTLKSQVEPQVIEIAKKLASYSSKDASKGAITQYCATGSPAREILDSYDPKWGTSHKSSDIQNAVTSEYYMYSPDCFTCHVTFDYIANFNKSTSQTYETAYTFCFVNQKGKMKLYNFALY